MNGASSAERKVVHSSALQGDSFFSFISQHLEIIRYRLLPLWRKTKQSDRHYFTNEEFWSALQHPTDPLRANTTVHLHGFALTEWLPRTPGVFHTEYGAEHRKAADLHRMSEYEFFQRAGATGLWLPSKEDPSGENKVSVIYDPDGKSRIIRGGIGCVRLKDVSFGARQTWFLGATSSDAVHEGIPVALSRRLYDKYINDIAAGCFVCNVTAKARFVPSELEKLYDHARHMPQMYLEASEVRPFSRAQIDEDDLYKGKLVTAAVGFRGKEQGRTRMFATFASFENGNAQSLSDSVEWLGDIYVGRVFKGEVVIDFDQQSRRFAGAVFSLDSLFHNALDITAASKIVVSVSDPVTAKEVMERVLSVTEMEVNVKNTVTIGDRANVRDVRINQGQVVAINSQIGDLGDRLQGEIEKRAPNLPAKEAAQLKKHGAVLKKKLAATRPDRSGIAKVLSAIERTAKTVGAAGRPILKLAGMLAAAMQG
jgi:hypothetical protein